MRIHEYQGRDLLRSAGVPVVDGEVAATPAEARRIAERLGCPVVVKAQVLVGGRGKAGGVKLAKSDREAEDAASAILALRIKDLPVRRVLVARAVSISREYYLGITVDRSLKMPLLIGSAAGGMEIEELAAREPEAIVKLAVDPLTGIDPESSGMQAFLERVFPSPKLHGEARATIVALHGLFSSRDCSLVEINPYAQTAEGHLVAVDAKVLFDDNALFRHPEIEAMRPEEDSTPDELEAKAAGLSFVGLDGEIGCIVNGAGLAMATMDLIKLFGGSPANFLDVGGSSNPQKVLTAFRILTRNPRLKAILINIFGGITRCDDIARGILMAREEIELSVPLVIRLIGTNEEQGREMLRGAGLTALEALSEAVQAVVRRAGGTA